MVVKCKTINCLQTTVPMKLSSAYTFVYAIDAINSSCMVKKYISYFSGKLALDFMNQNWYMVANELGSPIVNYCINVIISHLNQLLNKVPINNLIST